MMIVALVLAVLALVVLSCLLVLVIFWPHILDIIRMQLAQYSWWYTMIPEMRGMFIKHFGKFWRMVLSVSGPRRKEIQVFCLDRNLRTFDRWTEQPHRDWDHERYGFFPQFIEQVRNAVHGLDTDVGANELFNRILGREPGYELLWGIIAEDFPEPSQGERALRRYLRRDIRHYLLLPDGRSGMIPLGPPWAYTVERFVDHEHGLKETREEYRPGGRILHSIRLEEEVVFYPSIVDKREDEVAYPLALRIPNMETADVVELSVSMRMPRLVHDPYKAIANVRYPREAILGFLLPHIRQAFNELSFRTRVREVARRVDAQERDQAKRTLTAALPSITKVVNGRFRAKIGAVRLARVDTDPRGFIEIPFRTIADANEPEASFVDYFSGDEFLAPDPRKVRRYYTRYPTPSTVVGKIYNDWGFFVDPQLEDLGIVEPETRLELEKLTRAEFETQARIRKAKALEAEQRAAVAGSAAGLEVFVKTLTDAGVPASVLDRRAVEMLWVQALQGMKTEGTRFFFPMPPFFMGGQSDIPADLLALLRRPDVQQGIRAFIEQSERPASTEKEGS